MSRKLSITSVNEYNNSLNYQKYDTVYHIINNVKYYYISTLDNNLGNLTNNSNEYWKRFDDLDVNWGDIWLPSYNTSVSYQARVREEPIGELVLSPNFSDQSNYALRLEEDDGINPINTFININFDNLSSKEGFSLLAFFEFNGGINNFKYTLYDHLSQMYSVPHFYVVNQYSYTLNNYNIDSISATWERVNI